MFTHNQLNPKPFQQRYRFNINRYYRIWFSDNPARFLGLENELRFIKLREDNPRSELFFVYSASCLNDDAKKNLRAFCLRHKITAVDFDTEFSGKLTHELDKEHFALAQTEIKRTLNSTGGNLAAAADCARLIVPLIEKCGIYTDSDTPCDLSKLNAQTVELRAPILLNAEMLFYTQTTAMMSPNSDFLAFSFDHNHPDKLSSDAIASIRSIQKVIVNNYKQPFSSELLLKYDAEDKLSRIPDGKNMFKLFQKQFPENPTVFDFRKFILAHKIKKLSEIDSRATTSFIYRTSVINISGPANYTAMYSSLVPKGVGYMPDHIPANQSKWNAYLDMYRKSSIGFYEPIADRIVTNNVISNLNFNKDEMKTEVGELSDQSWTAEGIKAKTKRENALLDAGKTVHRFWKNKKMNQLCIIKHYDKTPEYNAEDFRKKSGKSI